MSSEESYELYSTPNPFSAYSNNYFRCITSENAVPLEFPEIALAGLVSRWCFDLDVPGSAIATVILPGEIVLHLDDLQPIIQDMEEAFSKGARSVSIDAIINGQPISQVYHFTKIPKSVLQTQVMVYSSMPGTGDVETPRRYIFCKRLG
ncbi:hypothetical protein DFH29DRAFT_915469 [Suillus ampliporus]|nr:hypothetical protein DFH29DRAFT_915469 [Suillus ampliporus]